MDPEGIAATLAVAMRVRAAPLGLLLLCLPALACSEAGGGDEDPLVARGRTVYLSVCTACHDADPARDGSLGPANAGASQELLEAKLLRGEYPPGYAPKRDSMVMPRFENLKDDIPALAAFLAAAQPAAPSPY
jgi:mono/diheme cytochrome c family protein